MRETGAYIGFCPRTTDIALVVTALPAPPCQEGVPGIPRC